MERYFLMERIVPSTYARRTCVHISTAFI